MNRGWIATQLVVGMGWYLAGSGATLLEAGAPALVSLEAVVVDESGSGAQVPASVAALAGGGFAVLWTSLPLDPADVPADGSLSAVRVRILDAEGRPRTPERAVNQTVTAGEQQALKVVATSDGGFVAAWLEAVAPSAGETRVVLRRFDAEALPVGGEVYLDPDPLATQYGVRLVATAGDRLFAAWVSHFATSSRTWDSRLRAAWLDLDLGPIGERLEIVPPDDLWDYGPRMLEVVETDEGAWIGYTIYDRQDIWFESIPAPGSSAPRGRFRLANMVASADAIFRLHRAPDGALSIARVVPGEQTLRVSRLSSDGRVVSTGPALVATNGYLDGLRVASSPSGLLVAWEPSDGTQVRQFAALLRPSGTQAGPVVPLERDGFPRSEESSWMSLALAVADDGLAVVAYASRGADGATSPDGDAEAAIAHVLAVDLPGAEVCAIRDRALDCDVRRRGAPPFQSIPSGGAGELLLGDVDGNGGEDVCRADGGRFVCRSGAQNVDPRLVFRLDTEPGDVPLLGDVNGDGRADPCLRRGRRVLCDTAHDGGSAEVQVRFGRPGARATLADVDGRAGDEVCVLEPAVSAGDSGRTRVSCDTAHDGGSAEFVRNAPAGDVHLADVDGDGSVDLCGRTGEILSCDTDRDGTPDLERRAPPTGPIVLADLTGR